METQVPDFEKMAKDLKKNALRYAGTEAVKFFKQSFVNQGFTDSSFEAWKKTNNPMAGNRILYKDGTLMQATRKNNSLSNGNKVVIENEVAYAEIHNQGGTITVTDKMKKWFWWQYALAAGIKKGDKEWTNIVKSKSGDYSPLSKHNKAVSAKAKFFRRLALMPVGAKIKMPKRQFMGNSRTMMQQFESWFVGEVENKFKNDLNKQ